MILDSWLIACCKLPPTLARQIWRHNYVIGRNEYLISTLSETTFPQVYSLQFLFKSTYHSWRYERKCEWVFFSEHSVLSVVELRGGLAPLKDQMAPSKHLVREGGTRGL